MQPTSRDRFRWVLFVVRDERQMSILVDSSSAEDSHRLALLVARNTEWRALERDPRVVGCFARAPASQAMCLRADGSFVSADSRSKDAARNLCREREDGRWAAGGDSLVLQRVDGAQTSGRYKVDGGLEFAGARWARTTSCAAASP
jgi:hypothetical protein